MVLLFLHMPTIGPIGVFDSGYGGLTVLKEIVKHTASIRLYVLWR